MIRQLFGRRRKSQDESTNTAPEIRDRLKRTIEQKSQPQRAGIAPAARDVLELLGRRDPEDGYIRGHDAQQIVTGLVRSRHPAQFAVELVTALPQLQPGTTTRSNVLARNYRTVFNYATGLALRQTDEWPLGREDLAQAMMAYRRHLATARLGDFGGRPFLNELVLLAGKTGDEALRELLQDLIEAALADDANRSPDTLREIESWIETAGINRSDIPTLRALDAVGIRLGTQRKAFIESAPPLLGEAVEAVLDGEYDPSDRSKTVPPVVDKLLKASKEQRGAALEFLLQSMVGKMDFTDYAEFVRREGRWAHEFAEVDRPKPLLNALVFELAKRSYELAHPDVTHQRLVRLLLAGERHKKENHRNILKPILTTVSDFPKGLTVQALRKLLRDPEYDRWYEDIEHAMNDAGSAERSRGGVQNLAPLELPQFVIGDFDHLQVFEQHYDNLFDPRLYLDPHDMLIGLLAGVFDTIDAADSKGDAAAEIEPKLVLELKRMDLPISFAQGRGLVSGSFFQHFVERAHGFRATRDAIKPFIAEHGELLVDLDRLTQQIAERHSPTAAWVKHARTLYDEVPEQTWLAQFEAIATQRVPAKGMFGTPGEACLRTLIYLAAFLPPEQAGPLLANYTVKECYVTETSAGMINETLGNACVWALARMPDGAGFPYLARILSRVKDAKVHRRINKALNDAAREAGISRSEMDEATIPTHGLLQNGRREMTFKHGKAKMVLDASGGRIDWMTPDGKPLDEPFLFAEDEMRHLSDLKRDLEDLNSDLALLPQRLQDLYLQDRDWAAQTWSERYLDHPVVRRFAIRLIWSVERENGQIDLGLANAAGSGLHDVKGTPLSLEGTRIRLWHPAQSEAAVVEEWRNRIEELGLTQPFAQAWREVYTPNAVETKAVTVSERWAGHIISETVAASRAQELGWSVVGDGASDASAKRVWRVEILQHDLLAEWKLAPLAPNQKKKRGKKADTLLQCKGLTFHRARGEAIENAALNLEDLPLPIYSEVMRHCDLIIGEASLGAQEEWRELAEQLENDKLLRDCEAYWSRANSDALEEVSKRRLAMVERLMPRLEFGHQLAVNDRALEVKGTRNTYVIHLFSGAASVGDRRLSILARSLPDAPSVPLPFEGDAMLLQILAKAQMLAADDLISEPDILSQL